MKKLFNVTVTYDVVVFANDADDAKDVAKDQMHLIHSNDSYINVQDMQYMPAGWTGTEIPFCDEEEEIFLRDLIQAGHAPKYSKLKDELKRVKDLQFK